MTRKDIPNVISVFRIVLVAPVIYFLLTEKFSIALVLFTVAGLSDALDGYLAKRFAWTSQLGSFLDPLADKLLLVSCFLAMVVLGLVPAWLFALVLFRDLVVGFGALAFHLIVEKFQGTPPFSSKLNTALQIVYLVMVIAAQELVSIPGQWLEFMLYSVAATTVVSGLEYMWVWGLKMWNIKRENHE
jgi:cardiolipin synthase